MVDNRRWVAPMRNYHSDGQDGSAGRPRYRSDSPHSISESFSVLEGVVKVVKSMFCTPEEGFGDTAGDTGVW